MKVYCEDQSSRIEKLESDLKQCDINSTERFKLKSMEKENDLLTKKLHQREEEKISLNQKLKQEKSNFEKLECEFHMLKNKLSSLEKLHQLKQTSLYNPAHGIHSNKSQPRNTAKMFEPPLPNFKKELDKVYSIKTEVSLKIFKKIQVCQKFPY